MERNHRMDLQYDGTGLHGWAKQEGLPTVQGALEEAFRTILGWVPVLRVAGRTDAGVHARRQVAGLQLPDGMDLPKLRRSLNGLTPGGIAVMDLRPAPPTFDARTGATSRSYRYFICADPVVSPFWAGYCSHVYGYDLDLRAMAEAAAAVVGRHHFTAFTPTETEHVFFDRTVTRCRWTPPGGAALPAAVMGGPGVAPGLARGSVRGGPGRRGSGGGILCLEIEADAFLRHMVRTLVGTMIEVGRGERSLADFRRLLEGAPREAAGTTAPPHGLFLWEVKYGRPVPEGDRRGSDKPHYGKIGPEGDAATGGSPTEETADSEA